MHCETVSLHFLPLSFMELLYFLIIGLIAGWIAGTVTRGRGYGLIGNIVVGIVGAVIGGYLFTLLGVTTYGYPGSLVMAVVGALVLLVLIGMFKTAS